MDRQALDATDRSKLKEIKQKVKEKLKQQREEKALEGLNEVERNFINECCVNLDHFYDMSDDGSVWRAGERNYQNAMQKGLEMGVSNPKDVYAKWLKARY